MTVQGETLSNLCSMLERSIGQCAAGSTILRHMFFGPRRFSPPHARVTSLRMAQQDKGAGQVRHQLGLKATWKWVQHMRHTKKSLIVVNELEDRATHGGGDVAFVARG